MTKKVKHTDQEWRSQLTPEQYDVCRLKGTEAPFSGEYENLETEGDYLCAACGAELFSSGTKFHSGSGWPSFFAPLGENQVETRVDETHGMKRIEVLCAQCESHLGHIFEDGPKPTGKRYCINSVALKFEKKI